MTRHDALLLVLFMGACRGSTSPAAPSAPPVPSRPARAPALDLSPGEPLVETPIASDALWQRAARRDPIDLVRLADREGALGLLAGVEVGRSIALTALAALPHAEDGELALGRLCELSGAAEGSGRRAVLVAIHGIIAALAPDRERLAGHDLAGCDRRLGAVAADARVPPGDRDLAESSRLALKPYLSPLPAP